MCQSEAALRSTHTSICSAYLQLYIRPESFVANSVSLCKLHTILKPSQCIHHINNHVPARPACPTNAAATKTTVALAAAPDLVDAHYYHVLIIIILAGVNCITIIHSHIALSCCTLLINKLPRIAAVMDANTATPRGARNLTCYTRQSAYRCLSARRVSLVPRWESISTYEVTSPRSKHR